MLLDNTLMNMMLLNDMVFVNNIVLPYRILLGNIKLSNNLMEFENCKWNIFRQHHDARF
jgi:hypothetical protein